jgi:type VI secretion system secreted protein Hcp
MAFDAFLTIDGVDSEATRKGFEGQIELGSFNFGAHNATSMQAGPGGGSGKAEVSSFQVTKRTDASSPQLFQACCGGKHFPKAKVVLHKAGGENPIDYLQFEFDTVFVEDFQWSGTSGGDDLPMEALSFTFGKMKVTYTPQKADGSKGSPVVGGWDLMQVAAAK